jgi:hypothetical protein
MKDMNCMHTPITTENRGISGQPLSDSTNPPEGDAQAGTQGGGASVNLDPKSREDEGR